MINVITSYDKLSQIRRSAAGRLVYARGAFDLLHAGHIDFLEFAKQQGDTLVLGIISDAVVRQVKGRDRPIKSEDDRLRVADAIRSVDYTFIVPAPVDQSSTELVLASLQPDVFVLFDEKAEYTRHFKDLLEQHGVRLVLDNSKKKSSTTALIQKMKS